MPEKSEKKGLWSKLWSRKQRLKKPDMWHQRAIAHLTRLGDKGIARLFERLPHVSDKYWVRLFAFEGRLLVLKNTQGFHQHGHNYEELRNIFLNHQLAARKGKISPQRYKLRSIKVFGKIGNYIIMPFIQGTPFRKSEEMMLSKKGKASLNLAYRELEKNFSELHTLKEIRTTIQLYDLIILGNNRPEKPEDGVWIFSLPYDFA